MRTIVLRLLASIGLALLTAPAPSGTLALRFFYNTPGSVEPTYHTAVWIEDAQGKIVRTLYVSQELSSSGFKTGTWCPDWVKQAHWDAAPKAEVAAVTAPTPNVGDSEMIFDFAQLGIAPGTYGFRFQVHIAENYNVLYRGTVVVGGPDAEIKLETLTGPGKLDSSEQYVRDVEVRYRAGR